MTLQVTTFYCMRCHQPTIHEHTEDGVQCIPCAEKRRTESAGKYKHEQDEAERFMAALDGAGNRGEKTWKNKKQSPQQDTGSKSWCLTP